MDNDAGQGWVAWLADQLARSQAHDYTDCCGSAACSFATTGGKSVGHKASGEGEGDRWGWGVSSQVYIDRHADLEGIRSMTKVVTVDEVSER